MKSPSIVTSFTTKPLLNTVGQNEKTDLILGRYLEYHEEHNKWKKIKFKFPNCLLNSLTLISTNFSSLYKFSNIFTNTTSRIFSDTSQKSQNKAHPLFFPSKKPLSKTKYVPLRKCLFIRPTLLFRKRCQVIKR